MNTIRNNVSLIGRIGKEPKVHTFGDGKKLARIGLITSERYRNNQGQYVTDAQCHQVVAWGKKAIYIEKYLEKGQQVAITGKLITRSFVNEAGEKRYQTEIHLTEITKLVTQHLEVA